MLQKMRESTQGWFTKVIVGIICFVFAVWGLETLLLPGGMGPDKIVAKVNDETIYQQEYYRALQALQYRMAQGRRPVDPEKAHKEVMDQLIRQAVLLDQTHKLRLAISDQEIDHAITKMTNFHKDGKFDQKRFLQLVKNYGMTPAVFREHMRDDMLVAQEQTAIRASSFVTPAQLRLFLELEQQKRNIQWATLKFSDTEAKQKISEEEIKKYYEENKSKFMTDEKVSVNYISLTKENFSKEIKIPEADIKIAYAAYISKEKANIIPEVAIILLKIDTDHSEASQLKKAKEIRAEIRKGADFSVLAKKYSNYKKEVVDKDTKNQDGKKEQASEKKLEVVEVLGKVTQIVAFRFGDLFKKAAEALKSGEISEPVISDPGIVLIKRIDDGKAQIKPLSEVRDTLVKRAQHERAEPLFQEASQKLADVSFEASDLTEPAKLYKLKVHETPFFSRAGGEEAITMNRKVINAAFSSEVLDNGNNSDVIQMSPTELVVLHLKKYQSSQQEVLSNVTERIKALIKKQKTVDALKKKAETIVTALRDGKTEQHVAKEFGLEWKKAENAMRQLSDVNIPYQVKQKAFSLEPPSKDHLSVGDATLFSGDIAIVMIDKVTLGDGKSKDAESEHLFANSFSYQQGQLDLNDYVKWLKDQASIKILTKSPQ